METPTVFVRCYLDVPVHVEGNIDSKVPLPLAIHKHTLLLLLFYVVLYYTTSERGGMRRQLTPGWRCGGWAVLCGAALMQHAIALKATLSAEVADKARATRLLKWVLAPWRRLWLGSGPARVSALAEVRQEKRKVGRILLLMEAAGQLPGVRLWAAQRMVATERAGAGWRRSMRWWDGKGQECGSAVEDRMGGQGGQAEPEGSGVAREVGKAVEAGR